MLMTVCNDDICERVKHRGLVLIFFSQCQCPDHWVRLSPILIDWGLWHINPIWPAPTAVLRPLSSLNCDSIGWGPVDWPILTNWSPVYRLKLSLQYKPVDWMLLIGQFWHLIGWIFRSINSRVCFGYHKLVKRIWKPHKRLEWQNLPCRVCSGCQKMVELATARKKEKKGKGFKGEVAMMVMMMIIIMMIKMMIIPNMRDKNEKKGNLICLYDQGVKCAHHENGRGGTDATEEGEAKDKGNLADKFRHHPIYRLSLGQVNTNITYTNNTNTNANITNINTTNIMTTQFGLGVTALLAQLAITFFNDVHLDLYTLNEGLLCGASFAVTVSS